MHNIQDIGLVSSVSDASALRLKTKVSELFGQMKELAPSGSLQSLSEQTSSGKEAPRPVSSTPVVRVQRPPHSAVATNKGFQAPPTLPPVLSRSYSTGLNKSGTSLPSENVDPMARSVSNASTLTSLCADISPCNSHFFEVLYVGKIKVSHKKVPESLIDDALSKFKQYEQEKAKSAQMRRNSLLSTQTDSTSKGSLDSMSSISSRSHQDLTKKVDFAPLPTSQKRIHEMSFGKDKAFEQRIKDELNSPSLTPLQTNFKFFSETAEKAAESEKKFKPEDEDLNSIEKEFDNLSVSRLKKDAIVEKPLLLNKNSIPIALEPNVLVLNWSDGEINRNLSTLREDDRESMKDGNTSDSDDVDLNKNSDFCDDITSSSVAKTSDINLNNKKEAVFKMDQSEKDRIKEVKKNITLDLTSISNLEPQINLGKIEKTETKDDNDNLKLNLSSISQSESVLNKEFVVRDALKVDNVMQGSSVESNLSESKDFFSSNLEDDGLPERPGLRGKLPENKQFNRDRSASIGTLNLNKTPIAQLIGEQNRTMLFQVGRAELRLISPDRKGVLLHRHLRDVASCVQGVRNQDHFGFICQEPQQDCFVGYVFKCESESVASDVVGAIAQAFIANAELMKQGREKSATSCEHCPMVWYHKLCQDLEGASEKRTHSLILRRIEQLPEEEQTQIITKYQGGTEDLYEPKEHNAFLMMLLRAHCEAKQHRHIHDTAENRSEFLNQYLGGSTIFMKAKRSLSSSFDHLLKRKASKDESGPMGREGKKETSPHSLTPTRDSTADLHDPKITLTPPVITRLRTPSNGDVQNGGMPAQNGGPFAQNGDASEPLSLAMNGGKDAQDMTPPPQLKSPMMDIFLKLGSPSPKAPSPSGNLSADEDASHSDGAGHPKDRSGHGSWRQAIFNKVTNIGEELAGFDNADDGSGNTLIGTGNELLRRPSSFTNLSQELFPRKKTKAELRELWRKGINQAILLIRMEKENARLRASQEVSAVKRIKLEYEDIGGCANENSRVWDVLTAPKESRITTKVDSQMLLQAIRHGVPRAKRGEVWYFLAEQFCLRQPPPDTKLFPNYSTPYETLCKQLTSHQHAILIDLGRTFPSHTYFSSPLGPGQLALFNLLKAYSLLDPEVGYCQGLSFVAGVLLLHLEETEAFLMLRHLMFRRGLRKQYLPDMVALQIQLYQLSRLLKDHIPELYEKFDQYDVYPTLYAAPWILTIFTSQFPLGFVTRVFDLLFLESSEVIFRVALALLEIHKESLLLCDSFEEIMEHLKHKMPNIDKVMLDKVIKKAFTLDFGRQLHEYHVEYNVLQEEMAAIAPKMEALDKLEVLSKKLRTENDSLNEQLECAQAKVSKFQTTQYRLENQVKTLEQTVSSLARYIATTHDKKKDLDLPNDIKKLCQQVQQNDRITLGSIGQKLGQSFTSKFSSTEFTNLNLNGSNSEDASSDSDDKNKKHSLLKTGLSTPNLFNKMETKKVVPVNDPVLEKKRQYLAMKKSYSCNAGLLASVQQEQKNPIESNANNLSNRISSNLKGYPLRVLDENSEYNVKETKQNKNMIDAMINRNYEALKSSKLSDASSISSNSSVSSKNLNDFALERSDSSKSRGSGFFAHSHEQIRQEKMQAEQLKRDFDENLKRLDARLSPNPSRQTSLINCSELTKKLEDVGNAMKNESNSNMDSGIGTPVSPNERLKFEVTDKSDAGEDCVEGNIHPLIGCDAGIKFEVHNCKLKSLKPTRLATK